MNATRRISKDAGPPPRYYRGADIPMREIRRFARQVAEQFDPDKIILFGSYAYGKPHADSDVDILIIMPARNQLAMAHKIHWTIRPPFPMDIIVRKSKEMEWRLAERESFTTEIVTKGKVLYEKKHARLGAESGSGLPTRRKNKPRQRAVNPSAR